MGVGQWAGGVGRRVWQSLAHQRAEASTDIGQKRSLVVTCLGQGRLGTSVLGLESVLDDSQPHGDTLSLSGL